ncbi:MAG TPA: cupin domain-containing protein [Caulobacterales bacterium]|jgi:quercetin dioxygenase-like cupin family protein|nr:cupin domain-containing protein [Caulobacterales bacterium]
MAERSPYIIRAGEAEGYSPANHTGTRNYRLVGPHNGAKYLEIALGDIERHEGSAAHAHPDLEQAVYILEGEAIAGINGVNHHVKAGDMMFFPANVFHDIKVLSERIKLLVIYSPPFGEDPAKVIHHPEAAMADS